MAAILLLYFIQPDHNRPLPYKLDVADFVGGDGLDKRDSHGSVLADIQNVLKCLVHQNGASLRSWGWGRYSRTELGFKRTRNRGTSRNRSRLLHLGFGFQQRHPSFGIS